MVLYIVESNTWFEGYGDERSIFGVYDSEELANDRLKEVKEELYNSAIRDKYNEIKSPDDVDAHVHEVSLNEKIEEYIGGYTE